MADKYEKQLVVKIEGSAKAENGFKGLDISGEFHSFEDIFADLNEGDSIRIAINSDCTE